MLNSFSDITEDPKEKDKKQGTTDVRRKVGNWISLGL